MAQSVMDQLQAILGHQSIRTTMDVYAQLKSADVDKVDLYPEDK
jgi:integrase